MQNDWSKIDLKNLVTTLSENLKQFGGFSPQQVREAGLLNEDYLRQAILRTLAGGPKTGKQIIEHIEGDSRTGFKPKPGAIYPLLENMIDEGLVSAAFKKDRKNFSITDHGRAALTEAPVTAESGEAGGVTWGLPKWVDLRGVVPVAASRLAKVSLEVSQYGDKKQQEAAAKAIDEARRKIHEILASDE
jgi:DNA-binding PadR family transcriptional regulator